MKYEKIIKALEHNGYTVSFFETSTAAAEYIAGQHLMTLAGNRGLSPQNKPPVSRVVLILRCQG